MRVSIKMIALHTLAFCLAVSAMQLQLPSVLDHLDPTNKDGFNYYKDYLRGKSDDIPGIADLLGEDHERVLYFYRTPAQLHLPLPPINDLAVDREFGKRTNKFKNHMLSKDTAADGVTDYVQKRVSEGALSWLLNKRNDYVVNVDKQGQDPAVGQINFK